MWFPQNPKVLVVDDNYDEVELLLKLFSLNGISYVYFDGKKKSTPKKTFSGIRIVILDIDLEGRTSNLDDKSKASTLAQYLSELITINNSPYYILFWTKHPNIAHDVLKYLELEESAPVSYKTMEKPSKEEMKKLSLKKLEDLFFSDLENESFEYFLNWEGELQKEISLYTNSIFNIAKNESENDWNMNMKNILSKLACSFIGKEKLSNSEISFAPLYATKVLNSAIAETLSDKTFDKDLISIPEQSKLSLESIAKLNSILFFEDIVDSKKIENGKVFLKKNKELLELLKVDKTIKKFIKYGNPSLVSVVLTPSCDIAHHKNLRKLDNSGNKVELEIHRLLYGVLIEISKQNYGNDDFLQLLKKGFPENIYCIKPFYVKNNVFIILFHFDTINGEKMTPHSRKFELMLKESLSFDLQTKLANHVNRLGNSMLEY